MTAAAPSHELFAELGLSVASGRRFARRAESEGLHSRQVRIGALVGSPNWVELRVPAEQLSLLAANRRHAKVSATLSPSPKDPRCKATCT